ncbi:MAG TPA: mannitol dehydrogenase family protein [Mycobacteriales bacterium]|nr:mannitol dehydrogenase family protein [Mycobacteriales bacterium]
MRLTRDTAALPVTSVHLGLGAFHRAHQAWYTHRAGGSGIAAFTGRRPDAAIPLAAQDGLYTLLERGADADRPEIIGSISAAHDGADLDALRTYLADPAVTVVTTTITEAGYHRDRAGDIDQGDPVIAHDIADIGAAQSAPGRLLAGLIARRDADSGPIAVVPCDNLAANGPTFERVMISLAEAVDPELPSWMRDNVSFVSTMVDRITPATTDADRSAAAKLTGFTDAAPVVAEPFSEWILTDAFPAARPAWESAGARLVKDVTPHEDRKLLLLNGSHSLLAYAAPTRGHRTVAEAIADDTCRSWVEEWWDEAVTQLDFPAAELTNYRKALIERYSNPRIQHNLSQIAADGSQKLPIRVVPVLRAGRAAGRIPSGAVRPVAGWLVHLRAGQVKDPRAAELVPAVQGDLEVAVRVVLDAIAPELISDDEVRAAIQAEAEQLGA